MNKDSYQRLHFLVLSLLVLVGGCASTSADLVLRGGKVVTVDEQIGEAQAIAIRGDRILAVGDDAAMTPFIDSDTRVIELAGKTVLPGFIEGHGHFMGIGQAAQGLDLMHVESWQEIVEMVAQAVQRAQPGEWILGRGWHQEKWTETPAGAVEGFPNHDAISAVSPNNPVCLTHASGHACFFNAKAMELAGVQAETVDPDGGEILRDESGQPTGIFRETAQQLVKRAHQEEMRRRSPEEVRAHARRSIQLADQECLSNGITSFQDAGSSFETVDLIADMVEKGEIGTRLWVMIRDDNRELAERLPDYRMIGRGNHHLTVRAIKRSIDGALGSRGAWLLDPYQDSPESTGLNTASVESVEETARLAALHEFQLCVHAIGDRANREVLDIFEETFRENPGMTDPRWRIEHAQHLSPRDIPRFASLGVIASMQGVHCTSDAPYVVDRLGPTRAEEGAYVWQRLMRSGALVTNGTDAPVEDVSPIQSYYSSVTRRTKSGASFYPEERMSRMEALKSYTINCAAAAFEEELKGSLTPGKLADVVVLSKDITSVPEAEILEAEVLYTIVGGKVLYSKSSR